MTYQIKPLPSKEEKARARRLAKAARIRRGKERLAKKQAKIEKLMEKRRHFVEVIKAKLLALDAQIAALRE